MLNNQKNISLSHQLIQFLTFRCTMINTDIVTGMINEINKRLKLVNAPTIEMPSIIDNQEYNNNTLQLIYNQILINNYLTQHPNAKELSIQLKVDFENPKAIKNDIENKIDSNSFNYYFINKNTKQNMKKFYNQLLKNYNKKTNWIYEINNNNTIDYVIKIPKIFIYNIENTKFNNDKTFNQTYSQLCQYLFSNKDLEETSKLIHNITK